MALRLILVLFFTIQFITAEAQKERYKVGVFLYEEVEVLDFAGPTEVFAATDGFEVYTFSIDGQQLSTRPDGVVKVVPDYSLENAPKPDILIFPGGNSGNPAATGEKLYEWIRKNKTEGATIMTVCSGASILAKSGLLEGLTITTNYQIIERMREKYPKITVLSNARFVDSGTILTTAGVSAGIDGSLHLVSRIKGLEVAKATAKYMEYDKWNPDDGKINYVNSNLKLISSAQPLNSIEPIPYEGELINEAIIHFQKNSYIEAARLLEASVKWYPNSSNSYRELNKVYKHLGRDTPIEETDFLKMLDAKDFSGANDVLTKMQKQFPGWLFISEDAIYDSGHEYITSSDFHSAHEVFKIYVKIFPNSHYSFESLAAAQAKLGLKKDAIKNYEKVLQLNPGNKNAEQALVELKM